MNAYETRVSQAFRGVEGRADSHEDLNPPAAAARLELLCDVNKRGDRYAIEQQHALSEAQLSALWAGIVANVDAARRTAARVVSRHMVEDVVHTAAVLFVEDAKRSTNPEPFPANEDRFRRTFLKMVWNHAIDCIRDSKRPACPVHSHWGIDPEPFVGGHNLADRELDTLYARNDHGKYDESAPTVRRAKDELDGLHDVLRNHLDDLSQTQREIIDDAYFHEEARHEIAARRGISMYTYDNHRKAACSKMRESLMAVVDGFRDIDLPYWYDRVAEMNTRHAAKQRRRAARNKEKPSSSGGDHSNF